MSIVGKRITEARTSAKLSQAKLAKRVGVSQATLSRLEKSESDPSDFRLLVNIAKALSIPVASLVEGTPLAASPEENREGQFLAICVNLLCPRNEVERLKDGRIRFKYTAEQMHPLSEFGEIHFCGACGRSLLKECPNCQAKVKENTQRYCVRCGHALLPLPSDEIIKKIQGEFRARDFCEGIFGSRPGECVPRSLHDPGAPPESIKPAFSSDVPGETAGEKLKGAVRERPEE